jgi:hypothetical protein
MIALPEFSRRNIQLALSLSCRWHLTLARGDNKSVVDKKSDNWKLINYFC